MPVNKHVRQSDLAGLQRRRDRSDGAVVEVAVAALWRWRAGLCEVLVTRRPGGVHLAGRWELPGGKLEPDETPEAALSRELAEEIGVAAPALEPLASVEHRYPDRTFRLHAMLGRIAEGVEIRNLGVAEHRWVSLEALESCDFPEANGPLTAAIVQRLGPLRGRDTFHD